jgi:TonB family protein
MVGYVGPRAARRGPGRPAILTSLVLHVAAFTFFIASGHAFRSELPEFVVYRVSIVSPPPALEGEPEPEAAPPEPPRVTPPEPRPQPVERPRTPPPPRTQAPRPATPAPEAAPQRAPDARAAPVTGEGLNVQIAGEEFPYPEYLENIIVQVRRYFRWTGNPGLEARVYFVVRRDGSVEDIRVLRHSGSTMYDFEAMGAVEQAGTRKAFGPLPTGWPHDRLPVSFDFTAR